jgi:hypothetical protein
MLVLAYVLMGIAIFLTIGLICYLGFKTPDADTRIIKRHGVYYCQFKYSHLNSDLEWCDMSENPFLHYSDAENKIKRWYDSDTKIVSGFYNGEKVE